jgi:hypothetical protein
MVVYGARKIQAVEALNPTVVVKSSTRRIDPAVLSRASRSLWGAGSKGGCVGIAGHILITGFEGH